MTSIKIKVALAPSMLTYQLHCDRWLYTLSKSTKIEAHQHLSAACSGWFHMTFNFHLSCLCKRSDYTATYNYGFRQSNIIIWYLSCKQQMHLYICSFLFPCISFHICSASVYGISLQNRTRQNNRNWYFVLRILMIKHNYVSMLLT